MSYIKMEWVSVMSEAIQVEHNALQNCFSAVIDGHQAILEYRLVDEATWDIHHTYVPNELRGKGVAALLAKTALAYAKEHNYKVVPSCSYIAVYLQRHPQ
ncbi:MAG TPA: GNAT family N-acetyltransferase [Thiopseudomonas sp.]|nr:GNAT family N-acetyltransferase [Thiopseudomonas sp.]